jgi:hypothetical protein
VFHGPQISGGDVAYEAGELLGGQAGGIAARAKVAKGGGVGGVNLPNNAVPFGQTTAPDIR